MRQTDSRPRSTRLRPRAPTISGIVLILAVMTSCRGCGPPCPGEGPADISDRFQLGIVHRGETLELKSSCGRDQLLGGGYWTDTLGLAGETHIGEQHGVPIILASFPSAEDNAWVARYLYRGRSDLHAEDDWILVGTHSYCVSNPELQLGVGIRQAGESISDPNGAEARAMAPAGAVVTGGGFRMDYPPTPGEPVDMENGYVDASGPLVQGSTAIGWRVRRMTWSGEPLHATAYVVYATKGIQPGNVNVVTAAATSTQYGWGPYWGSAPCAADEFTTGGGFEFKNSGPLSGILAHTLIRSLAGTSLTQWDVYGYDGYQTQPYGDPTTALLSLNAVCLKSPGPVLCVKITSPAYGTTVGLGTSDPAAATVPIAFAAEAYKGGTALPGSSISWVVNGVALGTGGTLTAPLPLSPPVGHGAGFTQDFYVQAVVQDGTRTASDTVLVKVVNQPPIL
jgi:hypothetical protein